MTAIFFNAWLLRRSLQVFAFVFLVVLGASGALVVLTVIVVLVVHDDLAVLVGGHEN